MKRFITACFIAMLTLCISVKSFAQQDPAARQAQMKQKLITELKMTEVQADSVVSINMTYRPQVREIYQDQSLSPDDKKAKMKAITDQADKRIEPVLGDSLFNQYKEWRLQNIQKMQSGKPGNN